MINKNRVRPDMGFDTNGHRDLDILSSAPQGELAHRVQVGNSTPIRSADLQRISTRSGICHGHAAELLVFDLAQ